MERRVPRYESSWETPDRTVEEWSEESLSELDSSSYVQRLEDEERYQRPRTSQLSVKSKRVLSETKAGIAVKPEEVEEFIAAIERLIDNSAERTEMGAMGRLWIEKQPTAKIVAEIYKDLLERFNK